MADLKTAREQAGLSQEAVARAVGTSLRTYIRYEQRERQAPLDTALALAQMLGIPLESLVLHNLDGSDEAAAAVIPQTGIASEDRSK